MRNMLNFQTTFYRDLMLIVSIFLFVQHLLIFFYINEFFKDVVINYIQICIQINDKSDKDDHIIS